MEDVADYADHIIVMEKGRVYMDEHPERSFRIRRSLKASVLRHPGLLISFMSFQKEGLR
jgi:ABC-type hemin transport system ATPase subunit